ncbi:MAG: hypothetical protein FJ150_01175 [Euryarchaeota archaeon]|nr:hypothetical protein [Euryarchaeota archaeon]
MQRAYVLLIGLSVLLISLILEIVAFPLALSFVILGGFFIAHFSKREEEAVNMIITATVFLLIGLLLKSMIHNISLSAWTLLFAVGSFFITIILMTIGAMINKIISARTKPKEA